MGNPSCCGLRNWSTVASPLAGCPVPLLLGKSSPVMPPPLEDVPADDDTITLLEPGTAEDEPSALDDARDALEARLTPLEPGRDVPAAAEDPPPDDDDDVADDDADDDDDAVAEDP